MRGVRAIAACLAIGTVAVMAPRQAHGGIAFLSNLSYYAAGGGIIPVGPQGSTLDPGGHFSTGMYGETGFGLLLGGEVGYSQSTDPLRTRMLMAGVTTRLTPTPEDYRMHVRLGAGVYQVSYHPGGSVVAPDSKVCLGGSFGVGVEPIQYGNLQFGGAVGYTGVVLGEGEEALSFIVVTFNVSWRPNPY